MATRSLADDLRRWEDDDLAALFALRPDLVSPVPNDLTALAARAGTRASATRALDGLNRFALQVVDGLVHLPDPTTREELRSLLGVGEDVLDPAVQALRRRCLLWGEDSELRLVRTVRDVVGSPAGLGPGVEAALAGYAPARLQDLLADLGQPPTGDPASAAAAVAEVFADRDRLDDVLAGANDPTRRLLDDMATGPPVRTVTSVRGTRAADASTAVEWLLAHGLLVATGPDTVVVPREVSIHLRGGRLHAALEPEPPPLETVARDPAGLDRTAAGAAFVATRAVEDLLERWSADGPAMLRSGGLGIRDLRRAAAELEVDEHTVALFAETAYAAGLLAPSDDLDQRWLPTPAYDAWRRRPTEQRWLRLVTAWLGSTRAAGLVGGKDEKGRSLNALATDLDHPLAADVRHAVLRLLAGHPGFAVSAESIVARMRWERPRRGGTRREQLVGWTLHEAETLGVLGRGALASYAAALYDGDEDGAADALAALLPAPVDHVLLQADLTAVAPGPLTTELARELALAADVESTGGATVYRFTESSVRRALDAGRSAADLHALLGQHSTTPVPQPLTYLVDDVSRRHGRLRVGAATAYLRCDDEALLTEILADRRADRLGLRRLAPTVLAAQTPVDVLLDRLREMGLAPMAESAHGDVVVTHPDALRSPARQPPARLHREPAPNAAVRQAAVRALRAGERASQAPRGADRDNGRHRARPGGLPRTATTQTLRMLADAAAAGRSLWIGYVDNSGSASERIVDALKVEGGHLTAYDHRRDAVRTFAVHRITGVAALEGTPWESESSQANTK